MSVSAEFQRVAVFTGSFNPVTLGHLSVMGHAAKMTPKLIIGVGNNPFKTPLFTPEERVAMIEHDIEHVLRPELQAAGNDCQFEVQAYPGTTVEFMKAVGASVYVRGMRGITDMMEEQSIAAVNADLFNGGDTPIGIAGQDEFTKMIVMTTEPRLIKVSSSAARELVSFRQDEALLRYVSENVAARLIDRMEEREMRVPVEPL